MKLAVVMERIDAWRGGAETSTMELSHLLAGLGHEVHVITTTREPSPPDLTIHQIPVATPLRSMRTVTFIHRAASYLRRNSFDLVHAIVPMPGADVYQPRGGLIGETLRRNVATRHSLAGRAVKRALMAMNVKRRSLLALERQVFREEGPLIVAVSKYVAEQCREIYGVGGSRVRVVFNGVNAPNSSGEQRAADRAAVRRQYHVPDDAIVLLFVAHNFRLKGLSPLVNVVARLVASSFKGFRLLIVGRDNPVRCQKRLRALGLARWVTFTGPTQRMASFYHAADVCVHPTYYDPCSRVVLEALSQGLPCITTRYNGAAEVITDGREGFVVDSPDAVDAWAERIRELSSVELRRKMSRQAAGLRDRVSMARHVRELDAVFNELLEAKRSRCESA